MYPRQSGHVHMASMAQGTAGTKACGYHLRGGKTGNGPPVTYFSCTEHLLSTYYVTGTVPRDTDMHELHPLPRGAERYRGGTRDMDRVQRLHRGTCKLSLEGKGRLHRGGDILKQGTVHTFTRTHCSVGNTNGERHCTDDPFWPRPSPLLQISCQPTPSFRLSSIRNQRPGTSEVSKSHQLATDPGWTAQLTCTVQWSHQC